MAEQNSLLMVLVLIEANPFNLPLISEIFMLIVLIIEGFSTHLTFVICLCVRWVLYPGCMALLSNGISVVRYKVVIKYEWVVIYFLSTRLTQVKRATAFICLTAESVHVDADVFYSWHFPSPSNLV